LEPTSPSNPCSGTSRRR